MCKMFLSFSIDVYVIFFYWNIWMNCTHFIFIGYLLMLTYFGVENVPELQYCFSLFTDVDYLSCAKCSYHSQLMFMWFSFTETYEWIAHTSSSLVIYWCWHILVWKMFQIFNTAFDYLLMLTIFHVQNVLVILNWCLCDFLVLKHMNELYTLHLHRSFTNVGHIFMWKMFHPFWISFVFGLISVFWSIVRGGAWPSRTLALSPLNFFRLSLMSSCQHIILSRN